MSDIVSEIRCDNCGAPLNLRPGELVSTCRYCGFTQVVGASVPFQLEHSLILNNYNEAAISDVLQDWMGSGFMKPPDLARKGRILSLGLRYLPFWLIPMKATSAYEGIIERISPPMSLKGTVENTYDWLVLGRRGTQFPTRDYKVPVTGKIPFDFTKIDSSAQFLNSELSSAEAVQEARDDVDDHQRFLAKQAVDRILSFSTEFKIDTPTYIHAPLWFGQYEYKGRTYNALVDGSSGAVLKADVPPVDF
jgi:hypothetical protein